MVVCDHNGRILRVFIDLMDQVCSWVTSCHKVQVLDKF
jgi:hypothetical protein